jgi:hypothetical protein
MTTIDNKDWDNFTDWWFTLGNTQIAEKKFGKEAERLCNEIDPKIDVDNLYTDILEKLAWENKLHIN